jgi:hypothetical protein
MREYRVTIDTLREQYLYTVEATDTDEARDEARTLALADGPDPFAATYVDVERLA